MPAQRFPRGWHLAYGSAGGAMQFSFTEDPPCGRDLLLKARGEPSRFPALPVTRARMVSMGLFACDPLDWDQLWDHINRR